MVLITMGFINQLISGGPHIVIIVDHSHPGIHSLLYELSTSKSSNGAVLLTVAALISLLAQRGFTREGAEAWPIWL